MPFRRGPVNLPFSTHLRAVATHLAPGISVPGMTCGAVVAAVDVGVSGGQAAAPGAAAQGVADSGPDAVMSAVLSTGLPWTAHTVPSSAYSRAVMWWVPRGRRCPARW